MRRASSASAPDRPPSRAARSPALPVERLSKLPLLAGVGRAELTHLARLARPRELAAREVYLGYGGKLPGFCFLLSGSLILWLGRGSARRVFRVVGAGESFCEAPSLVGATSPFEVRAQAKSLVLAVPVDAIKGLAARDEAFGSVLITLLAQRAMLAIGDLDASTVPAPARVAAYLASIARPTASGAWHAALPVTKTVLAARLGITKETLSRTLRALADDGLITIARRDFIIGDLERLLAADSQDAA